MQTDQAINSGNFHVLKPRKALNKAYLKVKPNRTSIEQFKANLIQLLDRSNDTESEEFHKNLVTDFLKKTYYDPLHYINTKGRNDLVVHNGSKAKSTVGVIIEAKKPTNKAEMLACDRINTKAFQELVLYYLRERITHKNLEVKYLIATNIYEWFIFDANLFETAFAQNKKLVNQFIEFEAQRLPGKKTDFFYKEIAEPFIAEMRQEVEFTHFDIRDYERPLRNNNPKDDTKLIALFKLFSPEHLLKLPFNNDSNSLDKRFYGELLHILGLTETKQGGKKLIERPKEDQRNTGSLLENAIIELDSMDKISRLDNPSHFGKTYEEQLFNVGLELGITWLNRILFLKLLEAQLITYHKGDKSYEFLNLKRINDYDDLNRLFFQVLARQHFERNAEVKVLFEKVPYLNSSLFEPTDIEHATLFISNLQNDKDLPIYSATVLKDKKGKKLRGSLNALEYLFEFLNAYDFSSEGGEDIQEDNKTLINASVLGLIFEKINGYKDGSFFTPGFITMYMCRETIRKAVVQKFNEAKGWDCKDLDALYDRIEDRDEANALINSLKICDPAVGSGHFLVSALNEMIAIKNDLNILQDRHGRRLKEYQVEVVNDELIVTDEDGELFEYNPSGKESQRIQEALFHEKQQIIENCLFGVDINPNSVKICRLRLWIELLKNAYYKNETELETLPNIDINIKCGNSLISRFDMDADLSKALKDSKWSIGTYRSAVDTYRNAQNKEEKREMKKIIHDIKNDFRRDIDTPFRRQFGGAKANLSEVETQINVKKQWGEKVPKDLYRLLSSRKKRYSKLKAEKENIENNKIYENAFEWRFEFPEILDDSGNYVGFDVIIGNPPYVQIQKIDFDFSLVKDKYLTFEQMGDIYVLFYERGRQIMTEKGFLNYITSNKWMRANYGESFRRFLCEKTKCIQLVDFNFFQVFEEASVDTNILFFSAGITNEIECATLINETFKLENISKYLEVNKTRITNLNGSYWNIISQENSILNNKLKEKGKELRFWNLEFNRGILTGLNEAFIINDTTKQELIASDPKNKEIIVPYLRGRDIRRFGFKHEDLWLIFTRRGINIEEYPIIEKFLEPLKQRLTPRNKGEKVGRKPGPYQWYEIQDSVAYYSSFLEEKLVYAETMRIHKSDSGNFPRFGYDDQGYYCDKTTFIATGKNIKFLLGLLNSKVGNYLVREYVTKLDTGGYMMQKVFLEKIPFIEPAPNENLTCLVEKILSLKKENPAVDTSSLEAEIDRIVYELYGLTEEEIGIVESS